MSHDGASGGRRFLRSPYAVALACAAVALALRAWVHHDLYAHDPLLRRPYLDDAYYLEMAARMARGETFDWFLAPLHPWLGALFSGASGPSLAFLGGMNAVLGALTSAVVALAAAACAPQEARLAAAWTGGLVHALAGPFVFHDVLPGQEAAVGLLAVVVVLAGVRLLSAESPGRLLGWAALLGIAVGLAAMGRGTSLVLLACALPALRARPERARIAAACAVGLLVALLPAVVHNVRVADTLSPFPSAGGANLYLTNGPEAREHVAMTASELGNDPWSIEERSRRVAAHHAGRDLTTREASPYWVGRTFDDLGGLLPHLGRKAVLFWSRHESGSNHAPHAEAGFSTYLGLVPVGGWWLLMVGAGLWWVMRRAAPSVDVPALAVAGIWFGLVVFFPVARYRLPALVAATVVIGAASPFQRWVASPRRTASIVLAAVCGVAAFTPVGTPDPAAGHVNVAIALQEQGAADTAVEERLRIAIGEDAGHGPANERLGRLRLAQGDAQSALGHFETAAHDGRTRLSAQIAALPAMLALGKGPAAWRAAQGLLSERPNDPELLANAALCAWSVGERRAATDLIVRAEQMAPRHPAVAAARARMR